MKNISDKPASFSALKEMLKSPAHYYLYRTKPKQPSAAMTFGSLVDCLITEPDVLKNRFYIYDPENRPEKDKTMSSKKNKEWKEEVEDYASSEGRDIVTIDDYNRAHEIKKALCGHKKAAELIGFSRNEFQKKIEWKKNGKTCRGIIDIHNDFYDCDIKVTADADPNNWPRRQAITYHYYMQAGMYRDGLAGGKASAMGDLRPFYFIVAEDAPPYSVAVYRASDDFIRIGIETYTQAIDRLLECERSGVWPSYDAPFAADEDSEGCFPLQLPTWFNYNYI